MAEFEKYFSVSTWENVRSVWDWSPSAKHITVNKNVSSASLNKQIYWTAALL